MIRKGKYKNWILILVMKMMKKTKIIKLIHPQPQLAQVMVAVFPNQTPIIILTLPIIKTPFNCNHQPRKIRRMQL